MNEVSLDPTVNPYVEMNSTYDEDIIEIPDGSESLDWIESNMDEQPLDPNEEIILREATLLQHMPTVKDFETWFLDEANLDDEQLVAWQKKYNEYFKEYQNRLRQWWVDNRIDEIYNTPNNEEDRGTEISGDNTDQVSDGELSSTL